jgi:hypothetical protein
MAWKVDKTGATIAKGWDPKGKDSAAQAKWNSFMNAVNSGQHPATAGKSMSYKMLNKSTGQAQIALSSSGERASFFVDEAKQTVSKVQLGGHT